MELKCTKANGGIVLTSKFNHEKKIEKLKKLHSEMNPMSYFFQEDTLTTQKTRMSITFS